MIEVAVILSGVVRYWPDFFIILLLLVANAVVGFREEREAGICVVNLGGVRCWTKISPFSVICNWHSCVFIFFSHFCCDRDFNRRFRRCDGRDFQHGNKPLAFVIFPLTVSQRRVFTVV
jgi:hypothetical protein